jgi:hypothetical protein
MTSSTFSSKEVRALFPRRFLRTLPLLAACAGIWAVYALSVSVDLRLVAGAELAIIVTGLLTLGELRRYFLAFLGLTLCFFVLAEGFFRVHTFGWQGLSPRYNPAHLFFPSSGFTRNEATYTYLNPGDSLHAGVRVRLNSRGFRDREHSIEKPPGVFRIVAIGSSVTFGLGVEQSARFLDVLERKLNESRALGKTVETISLAIPGYKFRDMLAVLRDEGMRYDPDLILVEVSYRSPFAMTKDYARRDHWRGHPPWWDPQVRFLAAFSFIGQYFDSLLRRRIPRSASADQGPVLEEGLREIRKLVGPATPVALAYIALPIDREEHVIPVSRRDRIRTLLESGRAELARFSLIDTGPAIEDLPARDLIIYPGDGHPNAFAHERYAELIHRYLAKTPPN